MGKVAFVFPGQGSQNVGMGRDAFDALSQLARERGLLPEGAGLTIFEDHSTGAVQAEPRIEPPAGAS